MAVQDSTIFSRRHAARWPVSWGSIIAGFMVFLAVGVLLIAVGSAVGLTFGDGMPGTMTGIWIAFSTLVALWVGGMVTGQWIEKEQPSEALTNGVMLWSLAFISITVLALNGLELGMTSMFGLSNIMASIAPQGMNDLAQLQSQLNLSDVQVQQLQNQMQNSANRVFTAENAREGAWWSVAGIVLSMCAAVGGALFGTRSDLITRELKIHRDHTEYRAA